MYNTSGSMYISIGFHDSKTGVFIVIPVSVMTSLDSWTVQICIQIFSANSLTMKSIIGIGISFTLLALMNFQSTKIKYFVNIVVAINQSENSSFFFP